MEQRKIPAGEDPCLDYERVIKDCVVCCAAVRFLDAQRISSLTRYLEHLHACGLAGADHTTLLLNCYTKLKVLLRTPISPSVTHDCYIPVLPVDCRFHNSYRFILCASLDMQCQCC